MYNGKEHVHHALLPNAWCMMHVIVQSCINYSLIQFKFVTKNCLLILSSGIICSPQLRRIGRCLSMNRIFSCIHTSMTWPINFTMICYIIYSYIFICMLWWSLHATTVKIITSTMSYCQVFTCAICVPNTRWNSFCIHIVFPLDLFSEGLICL